MSRFPMLIALAVLAALPAARAQVVYLDFADGGLANKGTLGGEADLHQPSEGDKSGKFEALQETGSPVWQGVFTMAQNGTQGPHLAVGGSENALRLDQLDDELGISFWVKWLGPDSHSDARQILISTQVDPTQGWEVGVLEDGNIRFSWVTDDGSENGASSQRSTTTGIKANEWHHVALTWKNADKEGLKFYIDGENVPSDVPYTGGGPLKKSTGEILIGCGQSYLPMNGALADLRLYDRVLRPDEVQELSQKGKP